MRLSLINQYPGRETTGTRISELLNHFSDQPKAQFRILVAFASGAGLELLGPPLRQFLDRGRSTFWIVGVDLGGTGREALTFLYDLHRQYPRQVDARVLSLADNRTVFHPKVFWFDSDTQRVVVVGSANATMGGLKQNFEVSTELELRSDEDSEVSKQLDYLWMSYSSPLPPLSSDHLLSIDEQLISCFGADQPPTDGRSELQHPLRGMVPRIKPPRKRSSPDQRKFGSDSLNKLGDRELVMQVLAETRETQVQFPVETFNQFFDKRRKSIVLRQRRDGDVVKIDRRPFIHFKNKTHRIEIDAIRGLPRPQIIRMWRSEDTPGVVDYEIVLKGTKAYTEWNQVLHKRGQRRRRGARLWLVQIPSRRESVQ